MKTIDSDRHDTDVSRRALLGGAGKLLALGALAAPFGTCANAADDSTAALVGTHCLTILYPNGGDVIFDFDYYRDRHMTMIMKLYGNAIRRFEIRKGLPGPDDAAPMYVAIANIWIADLGAFGAAAEQHGQKLIDDVPNFTNSMPRVQADEVYAIAES